MNKQRLINLLKKRCLFTEEFADALLPLVESDDRAALIAAASAMGEAVADQADSMADYYAGRGAQVDAGKLRANAKLLHREWEILNKVTP